jgi:DNA-binding MarR family transcriptional regulator
MKSMRSFGFMLTDIWRLYALRFEQRARQFELTLVQCRALVSLSREEGVSQARLAQLSNLDPMTVTRIVSRMVASGFLYRRTGSKDCRLRQLYLTPKAKLLLSHIWELSDATRAEAFSGVGVRERDFFIRVLSRMQRNLTAVNEVEVHVTAKSSRTKRVREKRYTVRRHVHHQ